VIEAWNATGTSGKQPFQVRVFADRGELWKDAKFGAEAGNPLIAGWGADPDHDGVANLLECAMALEPSMADASNLPTARKEGDYLTFTYRQSKDATDLTFEPQAASTLTKSAWLSAGLTETSRQDKGNYWLVTVTDSIPISSGTKRFMRLQVIKP
jgi:hypothetical protein